jgi:hypothetical protein
MKSVELTDDEINALMQLIDAGVRATGLQHAANAVHLAAKINAPEPIEEDD